MAAIFPDEGLLYIANVIPRSVQPSAPLALGLFTGGSPTTVPPRDTVLAGNPAAVAEPTGNNYGRVLLPAGAWGEPVVLGEVVRTTAEEQAFIQASGPWGPIRGFLIATSLTVGAGIALFYANFDSGEEIPVREGYTVRFAPFWQFRNVVP